MVNLDGKRRYQLTAAKIVSPDDEQKARIAKFHEWKPEDVPEPRPPIDENKVYTFPEFPVTFSVKLSDGLTYRIKAVLFPDSIEARYERYVNKRGWRNKN